MTTSEPEETPAEPAIAPAPSAGPSEPSRPKPPVIEHEPQPAREGAGGLLRPLAAGLVGGLVGGGIASLVLAGSATPKPDELARTAIRELQDRIKDQADKAAQLSEAVRTKLAAPVKAASPEELTELRSRLEDVSKAAKAGEESVQSLSEKVKTLEAKPAPQPETAAIDAEIASKIAPVTERLAGLERAQKEAVQSEITSQIAPLTERLTGLERSQNEKLSSAVNTAALSIAFTNLKKAIADGKPFATELAAMESLAPQKLPVSGLAPYKDTGVPSLSQLQHEFVEASGQAIIQHYHGKSESFLDEVLSRAHGAVQVTPSSGTGDTVEAILGRVESALKAGNLKGALAESGALDEPAKKELQTWLSHAKTRAAADEAVHNTDQALLDILTKSSATH